MMSGTLCAIGAGWLPVSLDPGFRARKIASKWTDWNPLPTASSEFLSSKQFASNPFIGRAMQLASLDRPRSRVKGTDTVLNEAYSAADSAAVSTLLQSLTTLSRGDF